MRDGTVPALSALALLAAGLAHHALVAPLPRANLVPDTPSTRRDDRLDDAAAFGGCRARDPAALLLLRVPKTATTTVVNALHRLAPAFEVAPLDEDPGAVGFLPADVRARYPSPDAFRARLARALARAAAARARVLLEGHVVLPDAALAAAGARARGRASRPSRSRASRSRASPGCAGARARARAAAGR